MESTPDTERPDSLHGPSRGEIAVYLKQLSEGYKSLAEKLDSHKDKTSASLEEIRITLAGKPSICPHTEQCKEKWRHVDALIIEKAKRDGAILGGRVGFAIIGSLIGTASSIAATWFMLFSHGKP